jgi:peptide-methionine (S)-S-oxide reductase
MKPQRRLIALIGTLTVAIACATAGASSGPVPAPAVDLPRAASHSTQTIVVSGGCFWGIQAVYQHVRGVTRATSGYAGGSAQSAHYEMVGTGSTGHAESVQIAYDP